MKTKLASLILACLTTLLASCASTGGSAAVTAATGGAKPKPYPLKTCIVTGNALDSMGDQQSIVHEGQVVKFCCEPCVGKFKKNPAKYLAKLR